MVKIKKANQWMEVDERNEHGTRMNPMIDNP